MTKRTKHRFSAEFKLEAAQLVLDQNDSIVEADQAMNIGNPRWINGFAIHYFDICQRLTNLSVITSQAQCTTSQSFISGHCRLRD